MATPWREVENNPEFQSLPPEQKQQAQEQYFAEVIAPQAGDGAEEARQQFFGQYSYQKQPQIAAQVPEERGFIEGIKESISGEERTTPELEALPLIGDSPEMNDVFTGGAWKSGLGLLFTSDPEEQKDIVKASFPGATFRQDAKGNYIASLPSGDFALQKPGLTAPDMARFFSQAAAYTPAGRTAAGIGGAARVGQVAAKTGITAAAIETGQKALGGEFNIEDVLTETAAAGALESIPAILRAYKGKATKEADQLTKEATEAEAARIGQPLSPEAQQASQQELIGSIGKEARSAKPKLKELPTDVSPDREILEAAERLGVKEDLLPSQVSRNPQYIEIEQGFASIPGSKLSAQMKSTALKVSQKADDLITEFGGTTDKAALSERLKTSVMASIDDLDKQAEEAYDLINQTVSPQSPVNMDDLRNTLQETADELGGAENLDPLEKKLLTLAEEPRNYALVDKERKKVGQALRKATGPYKNEESGTLKRLYGLLTDAQEQAAEGLGVSDIWGHAKSLVKQRKNLEENSLLLLGKDKAGAIMPKVGQAVKKLGAGDYRDFDRVISALPKELRGEAVISSLNDAFTTGARKEKQLSVPGFVDWYAGLNRNKPAKDRIARHMPPGSMDRMEDLYKVAQGMRRAGQEKITTGRIASLFDNYAEQGGMIDKLYQVGKKAGLAEGITTAAGVPGVGAATTIMGTLMAKKSEPITKAADDLLSSHQFQNAAKSYADTSVRAKAKQDAAEKALERSAKYQRWLDLMPSEERRNILRVGLMAWLAQE